LGLVEEEEEAVRGLLSLDLVFYLHRGPATAIDFPRDVLDAVHEEFGEALGYQVVGGEHDGMLLRRVQTHPNPGLHQLQQRIQRRAFLDEEQVTGRGHQIVV